MRVQPVGVAAAVLLLVLAALLPGTVQAYEFDMVFQTKCVMEDMNENEEVQGSFKAFNKDHSESPVQLDVRFEDPQGNLVFERHGDSEAPFAFTTQQEGEYKLCFTARDYHTAQNTRIAMRWQTGVQAHDWQAVAKKDNLNVIQTELLRLEHTVHTIHLELQNIRRKEEKMRDINEATNNRVAWFNILAAVLCCSFCALQLWYLNKFFKRKKVL